MIADPARSVALHIRFPKLQIQVNKPFPLNLAPFIRRFFLRPPPAHPHPHPHHRSSLLRYLFFPRAVRDLYRERLLRFRLDTLPHYKRRLQGRIYRFLVERQQKSKRRDQTQTRLLDLVRRHGRRLLLLPSAGHHHPAAGRKEAGPLKTVITGGSGAGGRGSGSGGGGAAGKGHAGVRREGAETRREMAQPQPPRRTQQQGYRYDGYGYGYGGTPSADAYNGTESASATPERGARRRRLAAMAGSMYRAGVAAASELREQYASARVARGVGAGADVVSAEQHSSIPGAFPQVSIVTRGEEQMVLFPTYAKRHVKGGPGRAGRFPPGHPSQAVSAAQTGASEQEYWKQEWARLEDEKAVVDVDVRGWIYMPSKGPMTRRNRMLIGLARRLSGIPAPTVQSSEPTASTGEEREKMREEQRIAREAREIERRGQGEKEVANRGGYSEPPGGSNSESASSSYGRAPSSASPPPSPTLSARTPTMPLQSELTDAELAVANANLMARIGPFMTTPLVQIPITIFFYNDEQSRSHTVMTDDSGHFSTRAALEFVPTHVRVLANENISTTKPIELIESRGVSLISDIDDTVKRSNIAMGAREIFRNTFVRELADLTIDGVKEWYHAMHEMGVKVHYCSNSPWQLFPVLATFFHTAGLPQGSIHLKQYSGMLQGIFEPVAERKKGTLEAILRDFPERKFLLVGDSGEADLEVYTELVVANPGRILAVFIRDVTTPDQAGFFDSSFSMGTGQRSTLGNSRTGPEEQPRSDEPKSRPQLPPRATAPPPSSSGPVMGTLIDFSDEPAEMSPEDTRDRAAKQRGSEAPKTSGPPSAEAPARKAPPPRPAKPAALRSASTDAGGGSQQAPPLNPRVGELSGTQSSPGPLSSQRTPTQAAASAGSPRPTPPPPPPPRRRGTPLAAQQQQPQQQQQGGADANLDVAETEALPPSAGAYPSRTSSLAGAATPPPPSGPAAAATINKKVDLWLRRLARAHETLESHGVKLYTWRRGEDVIAEAKGIVREALRELGREREGDGRSTRGH